TVDWRISRQRGVERFVLGVIPGVRRIIPTRIYRSQTMRNKPSRIAYVVQARRLCRNRSGGD
ncbi:MAG TPA: hypothetical protein VLV85_05905, partial [Stellaceae bacterium]|nr:hypothetical protein [Stellaceae bacterium]